jgi:fucose 4-O-acetylase-like acetyltransferase
MNKRDTFVDVAKGIAMLMVVRIHTEVFGEINAPYPIIAVPLFFFLSGFYDKSNRPIKEWLTKAFKSLIITAIIWIVIKTLYLGVLSYIKDGSYPYSVISFIGSFKPGVMWFLFALFYAKIGMWIVSKTKLPDYIMFPLSMFLGAIVYRTNLPLLLDEGIAALPFYYLGKICYPYIKNDSYYLKWLALIGILCLGLMVMPWYHTVLVPISSWISLYMYPVYFFMTALSFATVIWLSKKLGNQKWLSSYGTQTLGILVLHPLMLHTIAIVLNRTFDKGSMPWIIIFLVVYVIVCIISYYLSLLISKYCPFMLGISRKK